MLYNIFVHINCVKQVNNQNGTKRRKYYYRNIDESYLAKIKKEALLRSAKEVEFYEKLHILGYWSFPSTNMIKTNIVRVSAKSSSLIMNRLIDDVNAYYEKIVNIQDEYDFQDSE